MLNIGVVFGGVSCEHDISIITAMQVINNLDQTKYNVYPIYIAKSGKWYYGKNFYDINSVVNYSNNSKQCTFVMGDITLYSVGKLKGLKKICNLDYILVSMHGINGEDGSIVAISNMLGCGNCSPSLVSSAVCMDKCVFKDYVKGLGICNVVKSVEYVKGNSVDKLATAIKTNKLRYPLILKPAMLGSSIGIAIANNEEELINKLAFCLRFDNKILIEEKLENFREFNIAIVRSRNQLIVSSIEEPINHKAILDFNDKYISGNKQSLGMASLKRKVPADIDDGLAKEISAIACKLYSSLDLTSVVRFDFIYDADDEKLYLNEVNSIPGSYAYYLFPGMRFAHMLDVIIDNAVFDKQHTDNQIKYFHSNVLKNTSGGIKK